MPLHAIEIVLNRTVRGVELKAAQKISRMPMAPSSNGRSIAVLVSARDEKAAIRKVWRRLQNSLPVDVLCTLFPGPDGMLQMSIPFGPGTKRRVRAWAAASGKTSEEFLSQAVMDALARDRSPATARQECVLNFLLHTCACPDSALKSTDRISVSGLPMALADPIRRVSDSGKRIVFTDSEGPAIASLISERELRDLEDGLTIAECERRKAGSPSFVPHDEAIREGPDDGGTGEGGARCEAG